MKYLNENHKIVTESPVDGFTLTIDHGHCWGNGPEDSDCTAIEYVSMDGINFYINNYVENTTYGEIDVESIDIDEDIKKEDLEKILSEELKTKIKIEKIEKKEIKEIKEEIKAITVIKINSYYFRFGEIKKTKITKTQEVETINGFEENILSIDWLEDEIIWSVDYLAEYKFVVIDKSEANNMNYILLERENKFFKDKFAIKIADLTLKQIEKIKKQTKYKISFVNLIIK